MVKGSQPNIWTVFQVGANKDFVQFKQNCWSQVFGKVPIKQSNKFPGFAAHLVDVLVPC